MRAKPSLSFSRPAYWAPHRAFLALCFSIAFAFLAGCSEIEIKPRNDPGGGLLTDNTACLYDGDRNGFWYVLFVHRSALLLATHRHSPGFHLFVEHDDLQFYSRCSGRGEVIDIMGKLFRLRNGTVFFCDADNDEPIIAQLPIPAIACDCDDPHAVASALYNLSIQPSLAPFLSPEARARLLVDSKKTKL